MNDPSPSCSRVSKWRDKPGQLKELTKHINGVSPIREPARWPQGEIYAVGREIGLSSCILEEVVVAIVDQRAPKHKHTLHLSSTIVGLGEGEEGQGEGNEKENCNG